MEAVEGGLRAPLLYGAPLGRMVVGERCLVAPIGCLFLQTAELGVVMVVDAVMVIVRYCQPSASRYGQARWALT